jgi:hypothetical protein
MSGRPHDHCRTTVASDTFCATPSSPLSEREKTIG